jgi:integrase/recombinase XerD
MKKIRGKAKTLDRDEFKRTVKIIAANKFAKRDYLLLLLSFGLGLRAIEMAALKIWQVYNIDRGIVVGSVPLIETKNQEPRTVYLSDPRLKKALLEYIEERKELAIKKRSVWDGRQPLILSQKGWHFTNRTIAQLLKRIYKSAGIAASSHSGRRTFCTNLIEQGMDIRAIQKLMGHRNINQTAEYVQDNPERLKRITQQALY